jgi:glycosyltransferase involved in cell wall biosynthesis
VKVSVCVPTYNRADLLDVALGSLLAQTYEDFELVVLDNDSTDRTADVVAARLDPRLRYCRNPTNVGSIPNWNRCLEEGRGEFVAICHDDDVYDADFLRRGVEMLEAHPDMAFVHTAYHVVDAAGRRRRTFRAHPTDAVWPGRDVFLRYLARSHDVVMSTVIARRRCYAAVGRFIPELLCADFDMWLRLALRGDIGYVATPLVSYRVHVSERSHGESTTGRMDAGRWYRENEAIVRRAVREARGVVPGIERREAELIARTRGVWARRMLQEALFAASFGRLDTARQYLEVSRELAAAEPGQWRWRLAGALLNPLGTRVLRGVRMTRRGLRRVG